MADDTERSLRGLTIRIDRNICVGFGDCIDLAPEAFELDGEGICSFRATADAVSRVFLVKACEACPVDALTAFDEDGTQLVP